MKKIEEFNGLTSATVVVNPALDKYEKMPLFQNTMNKVGVVLAKASTQTLIQEIKNERIKAYFEQNMSIDKIAAASRLSETEVLLRLEEMGLVIDTDLDKYDDMDIFKEKNEQAFAFLEKNPVPASLLKEMQDRRIKHRFEQNMSIEQIAQALDLPKNDVFLALEEMGLVEPVGS
jgi:hypothetical protein